MKENTFLSYHQQGWVLEIAGQAWLLEPEVQIDTLLRDLSASNLLDYLLSKRSESFSGSGSLTPVGQQEIWASGVTYKRSEEARERESNNSNVYTRVYNAVRPELFFKSLGAEVVGAGEHVGIRADATWSVPEPELVIVLNAKLEVMGFTVGNDMSSRDIEGENPLYLPQAKMYEAACAIGPRIWLCPEQQEFPELNISLNIFRNNQNVFSGVTATSQLKRSLSDLVEHLGRCKSFPNGAMLFTGTGVVPPDEFGLVPDDVINIRIDPIGELVNIVKVVGRKASL